MRASFGWLAIQSLGWGTVGPCNLCSMQGLVHGCASIFDETRPVYLRLSCSPRCGPNDGPVWTCMDLSLAKESLITDLMPEKTYEASAIINWKKQMLVSSCRSVELRCSVLATWTPSLQEFLQVPHWTTISRTPYFHCNVDEIFTLSTHSPFYIRSYSILYYSPNIFRVVLAAFSAAVDRHKRKSFDFQILWSFGGVKAQTKAPGGGLIDQHQSRSLASESFQAWVRAC